MHCADHADVTTRVRPVADAVLRRLLDATRRLVPIQDEASAAQAIAEDALAVFAGARAAVFLVDRGTGRLIAMSGCCRVLPVGMRVSFLDSRVWTSMTTDMPSAVMEAGEAPGRLRAHTPAVSVPVYGVNDLIGILWIRLRELDTSVAPIVLKIFAAQAAAALENARLYTEASESARRQDAELATLAHELRNPVGTIVTALQVLQRSSVPEGQTTRLREVVERQAKHLSRLVEHVLDVARLRHGKLRLKREPVDLCDIVRHAIEGLCATGRGEQHEIRGHVAAERLIVRGDQTRLEQVVRNLLDNAIKYSSPGAAIDVVVEAADRDVVLSVRDEGIGIEAAMLPRLFDPLAQASPASARSGGGLGLGLPLVRAIVEQHGGSIAAHSDGLGKGSVFTVRLPWSGQ